MIAVSSAFTAAIAAATNRPTAKVEIDLDNVAVDSQGSSATATSTFSADFPAAGAIDGDRTDLNFGPASGAENGIGRSGWKGTPVVNATETWTLQYDATALPDADPTEATAWTLIGGPLASGDTVTSNTSILYFDVATLTTYKYERLGVMGTNAAGNTMEVRMRGMLGFSANGGFGFEMSDGTRAVQFQYQQDSVNLIESGTANQISVAYDPTGSGAQPRPLGWFRVTLQNNTATLYIDGVSSGTLTVLGAAAITNRVRFGVVNLGGVPAGSRVKPAYDVVRYRAGSVLVPPAPWLTPQSLTIAFGTSRKIDRVRVYSHLTQGGILDARIQTSPDGVIFTTRVRVLEGTTNIVSPTLGHNPYTILGILLTQISATHLRVLVEAVVNTADELPIILEVEAVQTVSLTDRLTGLSLSRKKDYLLKKFLGAELAVSFHDYDRFLSPDYVPTSAEVTAGFVNASLRPNLPIRAFLGFDQETIQVFDGFIDRFDYEAPTRRTLVKGRDIFKRILNRKVTAKLRSNQLLEDLVILVCQLCNIGSGQVTADKTRTTIPIYLPKDAPAFDEIQHLLQSVGDGAFYADETGQLQVKSFLRNVTRDRVWDTQGEFNLGTVTQLDGTDTITRTEIPGSLKLTQRVSAIPDPGFEAGTNWDFDVEGFVSNTLVTHFVRSPGEAGLNPCDGAFIALFKTDMGGISTAGVFSTSAIRVSAGSSFTWVSTQLQFKLTRPLNASVTIQVRVQIFRASDNVVLDEVLFSTNESILCVVKTVPTPNSYNQIVRIRVRGELGGPTPIGTTSYAGVDTLTSDSRRVPSGTFTSETVDRSPDGAVLLGWSRFEVAQSVPAGTTASYFLQVSDFPTMAGFTEVPVTANATIPGTVPNKRFFRWKAVLTSSDGAATTEVAQVRVSWTVQGGSDKFPATSVATLDAALNAVRLSQNLSDEIGGTSPIFNKAIIKSDPVYLSTGGTIPAWEAVQNGAAVSVTNKLFLNVGDTVFNLDFGETAFSVPQTVNITFEAPAAGTTALTSHPTKPVLTVTMTTAGNVTALNVTGIPFIRKGPIEAVAQSTDALIDKFDLREFVLENDFIQTPELAQAIATTVRDAFQNPTTWIPALSIRPFWTLQLQDRVTVKEPQAGIDGDYQVISLTHRLEISHDAVNAAATDVVLVKIV